ncbi:hypothetical protein RB201_18795 [Streptomyces sp. S1A(2023)]
MRRSSSALESPALWRSAGVAGAGAAPVAAGAVPGAVLGAVLVMGSGLSSRGWCVEDGPAGERRCASSPCPRRTRTPYVSAVRERRT